MPQGIRYKKTFILIYALIQFFTPFFVTSELMARDIKGHNNDDNGFTEEIDSYEIDPEPGKYDSPKACSTKKSGQVCTQSE